MNSTNSVFITSAKQSRL